MMTMPMMVMTTMPMMVMTMPMMMVMAGEHRARPHALTRPMRRRQELAVRGRIARVRLDEARRRVQHREDRLCAEVLATPP